ncbi:DUF4115 domain-containing protein [Moritella sp. 24]|uniref:RodZ domain-containing protein n=1 Tax=Moritella sp. 24 TaxID=2746230 RepID=UPI001BAD01C2|nr:RodZ domain-containing protein [Moritella sp. 24]QUM75387.1 DUF4115 domain-containing protein [Moritella sp. 24]
MTIDLETLKDADKPADLQDNIEVITAGQILQDARVALGISVKQVSDNINLKLSVIRNIEEAVADKDISPTFMRGYIRCYARYLKIDEDEVLRAYDCQNVACEQQAELQSFSKRTKLEAHDNRLMLVSYGIVGFMLIVFLIWGLRGDEVEVVVPVPEPSPIETVVSTDAVVKDDVVVPMTENLDIATDTATDTVIVSPTSVSEQPTELPEQAMAITPIVTPIVELESPIAANLEEPTVNVVKKREESPADNPNQALLLMFTGDCWIQIKDSDGKTLLTGVKKAGQTVTLQGLAPLSVKLGAPEQVTMSYAGEPVDLSTFRKGRLAKFKLPFKA